MTAIVQALFSKGQMVVSKNVFMYLFTSQIAVLRLLYFYSNPVVVPAGQTWIQHRWSHHHLPHIYHVRVLLPTHWSHDC